MSKLHFYQQLLQSIVSHDDTSENMSVKQYHGRALANESCHLFQTFSRQSEGQVTRDFCHACFQPSRFIKADSHCSQNSHHVLCDRKWTHGVSSFPIVQCELNVAPLGGFDSSLLERFSWECVNCSEKQLHRWFRPHKVVLKSWLLQQLGCHELATLKITYVSNTCFVFSIQIHYIIVIGESEWWTGMYYFKGSKT